MHFKALSSLTKSVLEEVRPKPLMDYAGVVHEGYVSRRIISPENFICPRCKGNQSFVCPDAIEKDKFLSCAMRDCMAKNAKIFDVRPNIPELSDVGVPDEFHHANFMECKRDDKTLAVMRNFCNQNQGIIVFGGEPGRGKTYSACAMLDYCLKSGEFGRYVSYSDLFQKHKAIFSSGGNELSLLETLQQVNVLVLDDLGTRPPTESFSEFIFFLIDRRKTSNNLKTIITTNRTSQEIEAMFGSAFVSRILSGICLKFDGVDLRRRAF